MIINKFKKIDKTNYEIVFNDSTLIVDENVILKYNLLFHLFQLH